MQEIILFSKYLTLGQILKESGIISTGGQAKYFLNEYKVLVNGEVEKRRGRKIYAQMIITLPDQKKIYIREATQEEQKNYKEELADKKRIMTKIKKFKQSKTNHPRFPGA